MSGHGQREARLRADAVAWRDRISHDMISAAGIAAVFFKPGIACSRLTGIDPVAPDAVLLNEPFFD
jgi:hypothetical protein